MVNLKAEPAPTLGGKGALQKKKVAMMILLMNLYLRCTCRHVVLKFHTLSS